MIKITYIQYLIFILIFFLPITQCHGIRFAPTGKEAASNGEENREKSDEIYRGYLPLEESLPEEDKKQNATSPDEIYRGFISPNTPTHTDNDSSNTSDGHFDKADEDMWDGGSETQDSVPQPITKKYLGILIDSYIHSGKAQGAIIVNLSTQSPAKGILSKGDIVLLIEGKDVVKASDVTETINNVPPDQEEVSLQILRNDEVLTLSVPLRGSSTIGGYLSDNQLATCTSRVDSDQSGNKVVSVPLGFLSQRFNQSETALKETLVGLSQYESYSVFNSYWGLDCEKNAYFSVPVNFMAENWGEILSLFKNIVGEYENDRQSDAIYYVHNNGEKKPGNLVWYVRPFHEFFENDSNQIKLNLVSNMKPEPEAQTQTQENEISSYNPYVENSKENYSEPEPQYEQPDNFMVESINAPLAAFGFHMLNDIFFGFGDEIYCKLNEKKRDYKDCFTETNNHLVGLSNGQPWIALIGSIYGSIISIVAKLLVKLRGKPPKKDIVSWYMKVEGFEGVLTSIGEYYAPTAKLMPTSWLLPIVVGLAIGWLKGVYQSIFYDKKENMEKKQNFYMDSISGLVLALILAFAIQSFIKPASADIGVSGGKILQKTAKNASDQVDNIVIRNSGKAEQEFAEKSQKEAAERAQKESVEQANKRATQLADEAKQTQLKEETKIEDFRREARRQAMREADIPTSKQPVSQSRNASGYEYSYEVPKKGGGTELKSVQEQTLDRNHIGKPHWEAGSVKVDPLSGKPRENNYGRPALTNDKKKVYH